MLHILSLILAQYYYGAYDPGIEAAGTGAGYEDVSLIGLVVLLLAGVIGSVVQSRMQESMKKYSATPAGMTGAVAARMMLDAYGLSDVRITQVRGQLTDHYNPADRTVNLSGMVFSQPTVAAVAVAAHECGHAVQHAKGYPWLGLRSQLVPLVNIGSRVGQVLLVAGLMLAAIGGDTTVAWVGLGAYACTTLFALVTLPVEFDASRRALAWLQESGAARGTMHDQATTALRWAAMTYVAAALSSIAMLLYYVLIILRHSRHNNRG